MRYVFLLLVMSTYSTLLSQTSIKLINSFGHTRFIDFTSSRIRYDTDLFGFRIGAFNYKENRSHDLNIDLHTGLSSKGGFDYISDRPFYLNVLANYTLLFDIVSSYSGFKIRIGPGLNYDLEGFIPNNLDGPNMSWIQTLGLSVNIKTILPIARKGVISLGLGSPFIGVINRPAWTGSIDKEIDDLADKSYVDVLSKRGIFHSYHNYFSICGNITYRNKVNKNLEFIISDGIIYAATVYPRYYNRLENKLYFGLLLRVAN